MVLSRLKQGPVQHLEEHLRSLARKGRGERDRLLQTLNAPGWLLSKSLDTTLGEASLGVVSVACALASPLGVTADRLFEVVQIVNGLDGVDASYPFEIRRYVKTIDTVLRKWVPGCLRYLGYSAQAQAFESLSPLETADAIYTAYAAVSDGAHAIGGAGAFVQKAKSLQDAMCVQAVGFSLSAVQYLGDAMDKMFLPSETIPPLRAFYNSIPVFLCGSRVASGADYADGVGIQLLRELMATSDRILEPEMTKLGRALTQWDKVRPN